VTGPVRVERAGMERVWMERVGPWPAETGKVAG